MRPFQSSMWSFCAGFGLPPIISGVEGNLPVPVTVGEGVEQGVEILRSGTVLCLWLFLALLVVEGVGNEVCEDVDNGVCEDVDNGVCIVRIDVEGGGPTRVGCPFVDESPVLEDGRDADNDPVADDVVGEGDHIPVGEDFRLPTRVCGAKDVGIP